MQEGCIDSLAAGPSAWINQCQHHPPDTCLLHWYRAVHTLPKLCRNDCVGVDYFSPFSFNEVKFVLATFFQECTDKAIAVHYFPWIGLMLCITPQTIPLLQTTPWQKESWLTASLTFLPLAPLCIQQNHTYASVFLGHSQNCCASLQASHPFGITHANYTQMKSTCFFPFVKLHTPCMIQINQTANVVNGLRYWNSAVFIPSLGGDSRSTMVWVWGMHSYLYLPKCWSGTCYLAYLLPAISAEANPFNGPCFPACYKRAARISQWQGILGILVPMTGSGELD